MLIALLVAALPLGAGVSAAQPRRDNGVDVIAYDDVNFQGPAVTLRDDVADLREFRLNDRISSLQMAPGESWEVCENVNFGGRCAVLSGSERDLRPRGWNDMISSMRRVRGRDDRRAQDRDDRRFRDDRIEGGRGSITVYDDVNFQGPALNLRNDVPDLREFRLNDRISSLQVAPGETWEVCESVNFSGRCGVITGSERDLRPVGWNDMISSIRRVRDRDDRRGGNDRNDRGDLPGRSEIVLFDQLGYRGAAENVSTAVAALGAFGNRARSAQVLGGVWELCEEPGWGGRCMRIEGSVSDLQAIGLRGVASARPLDPTR